MEYSEWIGYTVEIVSGDGLTCPDNSIYDGECFNAMYMVATNVVSMGFVTTEPIVGHDTSPSDPYEHDHVTCVADLDVEPYNYISVAVEYDDDYLSIGWM